MTHHVKRVGVELVGQRVLARDDTPTVSYVSGGAAVMGTVFLLRLTLKYLMITEGGSVNTPIPNVIWLMMAATVGGVFAYFKLRKPKGPPFPAPRLWFHRGTVHLEQACPCDLHVEVEIGDGHDDRGSWTVGRYDFPISDDLAEVTLDLPTNRPYGYVSVRVSDGTTTILHDFRA